MALATKQQVRDASVNGMLAAASIAASHTGGEIIARSIFENCGYYSVQDLKLDTDDEIIIEAAIKVLPKTD